MPALPSSEAILEYLDENGLDNDYQSRKAAALALARQQEKAQPATAAGIVLCSSSAQLADGRIETVTTFYPAGETAHEQ